MDTGMILTGIIYYSCLFMVVLVSIVGGGVFIEKRLSPTSWFRNLFAVMAGIGTSVISLLIVYTVGVFVSFNNSYLSLNPVYIFVAVVLVSILGGYIGGKVARRNEIVHGVVIGFGLLFLSVCFGNSYFIGRHNVVVLFIHAAWFCATVLGSYFALFQRERNQTNLTAHSDV